MPEPTSSWSCQQEADLALLIAQSYPVLAARMEEDGIFESAIRTAVEAALEARDEAIGQGADPFAADEQAMADMLERILGPEASR